ncbi:hypothetical protein KI387_031042, partial [Taxus chinensis]
AGSNLASPSCSPVKYGDSATATISVKNESKFSDKEMLNVPSKHSEVGKSSSIASDGSMMGAEYTSKTSSLSKLVRQKEARERAKKKSQLQLKSLLHLHKLIPWTLLYQV